MSERVWTGWLRNGKLTIPRRDHPDSEWEAKGWRKIEVVPLARAERAERERDEAEAEVERLRDAAEAAFALVDRDLRERGTDTTGFITEARSVLRAALSGQEAEDE